MKLVEIMVIGFSLLMVSNIVVCLFIKKNKVKQKSVQYTFIMNFLVFSLIVIFSKALSMTPLYKLILIISYVAYIIFVGYIYMKTKQEKDDK